VRQITRKNVRAASLRIAITRFLLMAIVCTAAFAPSASLGQHQADQRYALEARRNGCESGAEWSLIVKGGTAIWEDELNGSKATYELDLTPSQLQELRPLMVDQNTASWLVPWFKAGGDSGCEYVVSWPGLPNGHSWSEDTLTVPSTVMALWNWAVWCVDEA